MFLFFFFKQKTAYEMRISDWSSDVCSSDLIDQEFAIIAILSGRGIAGEGNARGGRITHVSEYHRLHIDRRAPIPGNRVQPAVDFGPLSLPGTENGADGAPSLIVHILRAGLLPLVGHNGLVFGHAPFPIFRTHLRIKR